MTQSNQKKKRFDNLKEGLIPKPCQGIAFCFEQVVVLPIVTSESMFWTTKVKKQKKNKWIDCGITVWVMLPVMTSGQQAPTRVEGRC